VIIVMARSSISIVLPVKGESLDWIQDICNVATWEASDIFIVVSRDDDPISMKPGGSFERVRVLQQGGTTKRDALNLGLSYVRTQLVCFIDGDVILRCSRAARTSWPLATDGPIDRIRSRFSVSHPVGSSQHV